MGREDISPAGQRNNSQLS